jgi:hypothetical protein
MRHFFSKGTVEASVWCVKCHRDTMHAVSGGRPLYCMVCQAKPLAPAPAEEAKPRSGDLFPAINQELYERLSVRRKAQP